MALQKELWSPVISENLFRGIEAIRMVATDDAIYREAKTIHLPSAGTAGSVTVGNTTYPVSVSERTDQEVTYDLTNFEIGPYRVGWADQLQLSYDKISSIVNDYMGNLSERIAAKLTLDMYHYTAGAYVTTTGADVAGHATGATGNRKSLIGANVRSAAELMTKQKVAITDRYLLLDYAMFWQLVGDLSYGTYRADVAINAAGFNQLTMPLYGFTVIEMPFIGYATSAGVVRAYGNAGATTDVAFGLAVQKQCASYAFTDIQMFDGEGRPEYFGDLLSASIYGGAKYRRFDKKGVIPIIQGS